MFFLLYSVIVRRKCRIASAAGPAIRAARGLPGLLTLAVLGHEARRPWTASEGEAVAATSALRFASAPPFQEEQQDRRGGQPDSVLNCSVHHRRLLLLSLDLLHHREQILEDL
jgi:hypothetical protein